MFKILLPNGLKQPNRAIAKQKEKMYCNLQVHDSAHINVRSERLFLFSHRCLRNPNLKISSATFLCFKPKEPFLFQPFAKKQYLEMGSECIVKKPGVLKISSMAQKEREVIAIDDSCPSPDQKGTPLRPIFCLKNRKEIKKFEETEECFILEFDPYNDLEILKLSFTEDLDNAEADLSVVAEKGQVACRDYPHPRNTCAKYPFEKTPHDSHCELCYCYVCDSSAPCSRWTGSAGHCHAFNNEAWNKEKKITRKLLKTV